MSESSTGGCSGHTHILDSLLGAPPVTLATRSAANSCFRSFSCVVHKERVSRGDRARRTTLAVGKAATAPPGGADGPRTLDSRSDLVCDRNSWTLNWAADGGRRHTRGSDQQGLGSVASAARLQ